MNSAVRTVLVSLLGLLLVGGCSKSKPSDGVTLSADPAVEPSAIPATAPSAPAKPVDPALAKAKTAWNTFDGLRGPQFRTLAMLQAHRLQANQGLDFLPPDEAKRVKDWNSIQFRERVPGVLIPGETGRAVGDDATTIVPSDDAARCAQLAKAWQSGDQGKQLSEFGFKTVQCGTQTWKLPPA